MKKTTTTGLKRILHAAVFTSKGLRSAWSGEAAFRQEAIILILVIPAGLIIGETFFEKGILICAWLLVLVVELLNSAVESVVDRIGSEIHPLSGRAKDMGSAAVFISICVSVILWAGVIYDRFAK